jgi:hypothetical protein
VPLSSTSLRIRRAELVALLSLGTDLGLGQPMEHMIRACLIALRLGERLGLSEAERGVVYYSVCWRGLAVTLMRMSRRSGSAMTRR